MPQVFRLLVAWLRDTERETLALEPCCQGSIFAQGLVRSFEVRGMHAYMPDGPLQAVVGFQAANAKMGAPQLRYMYVQVPKDNVFKVDSLGNVLMLLGGDPMRAGRRAHACGYIHVACAFHTLNSLIGYFWRPLCIPTQALLL